MFRAFVYRVPVFVLAFCLGILVSGVAKQSGEALTEGTVQRTPSPSAYFVTVSARGKTRCEEKDIFKEQISKARKSRSELEKRLVRLRSELAQLEKRWPMPERPALYRPESMLEYEMAVSHVPMKHQLRINELTVQVSVALLSLEALERAKSKPAADLLYREICS